MNEELTIQDLCDLTGLPRRTIHFYIQQGILPPPQGSGLGARYLPDHLLKLKLIPILRKQGLRLDDIRLKFQSASSSELAATLSHMQTEISEPHPILPAPIHSQPNTRIYTAYSLPRGMILMVPENAGNDVKIQLQKILETVRQDIKYGD